MTADGIITAADLFHAEPSKIEVKPHWNLETLRVLIQHGYRSVKEGDKLYMVKSDG